jgi:hypothetical protein
LLRYGRASTDVKSGDVLVSHPTAVREHEISFVPNTPHATSPTHDTAISAGRSEADAKGTVQEDAKAFETSRCA